MFRPAPSFRLLAAVSLYSLAGCSDIYDLGIRGPSGLLAVGASAVFKLQYGKLYDCVSDRVVRCGAGNANSIVQTTAISVDEPSLLAATLAANGDIAVRALAAGKVKLSATGIDAAGKTQSESRDLYLMTPDSLVATLPGPCSNAPEPKTWTVPVGASVPLELVVKSGTNTLFADGWMPSLDPGALTLVSGTYPFVLQAPAAPVETQVKIGLAVPFMLPVRVYEPAQIDSVWLAARKPGPYVPNQDYVLDFAPALGGQPLCQEAMPQTVVSVSILTADLCSFWVGDGQSAMLLPSPQEGATLRAITLRVHNKPGTCRVQASIAGGITSPVLELLSAAQ